MGSQGSWKASQKNVNEKYLKSFLFAGLCAFVFLIHISSFRDLDVWWHMKTGQYICETGTIPKVDIFSWTIHGKHWTSYEWVTQILFWQIYKHFGPNGMTVFYAGSVTLSFILLFLCTAPHFYLTSVLLTFAYVWPLILTGNIRPWFADFIICSLILLLLLRRQRGDGGTNRLWLIPVLIALWTNMHGGAALVGVALTGMFLADRLARIHFHGERDENIKFYSGLILFSFLALLANPHGWKILWNLYSIVTFPTRKYIIEWWRPTLPSFGGFYGFWLILGFLGAAVNLRFNLFLSQATLFFCLLSLQAVRHMPLCSMMIAPGIITAAGTLLKRIPKRFSISLPESHRWLRMPMALSAVLLSSALVARNILVPFEYPFGFGLNEPFKHAADFILKNRPKGRMFNEYNSGGYLIWRLYPVYPVFVDGRNVEYPVELTQELHDLGSTQEWRKFSRKYDFDFALFVNEEGYPCRTIDQDPDWVLVYWDDACLIYLRKGRGNDELIRRYGYRLLRPNNHDQLLHEQMFPILADAAKTGELFRELDRALEQNPESVTPRILKAHAQLEMGQSDAAITDLQSLTWSLRKGSYDIISGQVYYVLGSLIRTTGNLFVAIDLYRLAIYFSPRNSLAYSNLAKIYFDLHQYETARRYWREALKINPVLPAASNGISFLDKLDLWKRQVLLNPQEMESYLQLGSWYDQAREDDKAEKFYRAALTMAGKMDRKIAGGVALQLARYFLNRGRNADGISFSNLSLAKDPDNPQAYETLGRLYLRSGRLTEAVAVLEKRLRMKSLPGADPYVDLASSYLKLGRGPEGLQMLKKAISIDPDSSVAYYNMGIYYLTLQDRENAIKFLRKSYGLNPSWSQTRLLLYSLSQGNGSPSSK